MYCSYCGTKTKGLTKDVTYDICKNIKSRMCEITETPNMMGDSLRTYDTELSLEKWMEFLGKESNEYEEEINKTDERIKEVDLKIAMLDSITKLREENKQLKKKNKKLKKEIKKLKE